MQLNNIIYDKDTLAAAIAEQWNLESKTFQAMYPSETATSLVNGMAAYGSMLQYMLVAQLANCYIDTAFSDSAVYQLADTLGNNLHGNSPSKGLVTITRNNLIYKDITIPADCEFKINNKSFFNPSGIIFPAGTKSVTDITLSQGEVMNVTYYTTGVPNEKIYFGDNFKVDNESVKVWVNEEQWHVEESFLNYDQYYVTDTSELNTVILKTTSTGRCYIKFGNGDFANLPNTGSVVKIRYVINEGTSGNIEENNVEGTFLTPLTFVDNQGKDTNLDVTVITKTPVYGGFNQQSIDTLRQTSPNVFASGHRLIRREDYKAFLINKLGYLTTQVWGEYEEEKTQGIDDAIMMNVVYYTGLKSYEYHPFYTIGQLNSTEPFTGLIASTRGFYGSFALRVTNSIDEINTIDYRDNSGKGILFYQAEDETEDVDDLLRSYSFHLEPLPADPSISIIKGDDNNAVELEVRYGGKIIDTSTMVPDIQDKSNINNIISNTGKSFQSLRIPTLENPIQIILKYNKKAVIRNHGMSLAGIKFKPVDNVNENFIGQFAVYATIIGKDSVPPDFDNVRNNPQWSRIIDKQELVVNGLDYTDWVATNSFLNKRIYDEATVNKQAYSDPNAYDSGDFWSYVYYVIEIYSTDSKNLTNEWIEIESMKVKYNFDYVNSDAESGVSDTVDLSSRIDYEANGALTVKFPDGLINSPTYRLWLYSPQLDRLTSQNGYKNGDILGFVYTDDTDKLSIPFRITIMDISNSIYLVEMGDVDNFETTNPTLSPKLYSESLKSVSYITMQNPTDLQPIYFVWGALSSGSILYTSTNYEIVENDIDTSTAGAAVSQGDILYIKSSNPGTYIPITMEVKLENEGKPTKLLLLNNCSFGTLLSGKYDVYKKEGNTFDLDNDPRVAAVSFKSTTNKNATSDVSGTAVIVTTLPTSDISTTTTYLIANGNYYDQYKYIDDKWVRLGSTNYSTASGGTIKLTSSPNLNLDVSFTGNRIDKLSIDAIDQVTLAEYNHFTTLVEFRQPEVQQIDIYATVCLDTNANIQSAEIIQNIKNAIIKLFDITPYYMGAGLKISDIYKAVSSVDGVKFCNILKPTSNVEVKPNKIMVLGNLNISEITESYK